ncbi:DNA-binding SARP family transcriptional activator/RecA/RadA recombinase [Geodermatophilus bullaregiensis]|uniref:BTAD domain-containing putative transcriptional regulator n=1 Tax=Geodermatophilus bullaregiensis TaxID=1564160 RepID=UPI00195ADD43|nr:BTAD domain-containing putative transcriptional regulator [Geodermatophilus bullaregiensis]MBM7809122.1 DNA-binding SARP family transcriptional activator/RecA/RadA recombinase [Geodermatophilus bullaregiensis]
MQFDILGPLQVLDAGRPLVLGRPKQRAVLAILLLDAGTVVSLDRLVEELWGPHSPPQALASVQAYVSHLRRLLEPRRAPGAPATVIVNQAPGYRLVVGPDDLDATRFETLAREGHDLLQQGEAPRAAETLEAALGLWRGPVLADLADASFVQAERARLEDLRLTALEDRLSADLGTGRHARIVAELERLTGEHPFRERLQGLRMTALYRCGRQAEALQSYQRFRGQLREELGLDPGQALRDLEQDVLRQAPHLDWTAATADHRRAPGPAPAVAPVTSRSDVEAADVEAADVVAPAAPGGLVGRDAHLRVIDEALAATATGRGRVVLVAGEPGIGKTELAEEAARRARASGVAVGWGRSDQDAGAPPFWPWTQVLRTLLGGGPAGTPGAGLGVHAVELAPILPELADGGPRPPAPVVDPEAARFRLCQAATAALRELASGRRLLVVLDDLQWADVASHRLLSHLATTLADTPVVVLATYRDRDLDGREPLADTLAELARAVPVDRLELTGLEVADVAQVMASHTGTDPDEELARLIGDRTGGNPFFVLEVLRLLGTNGWPGRTTSEAAALVARQVPAGVRDVLRRRLGRLPDQTRTVLLVAAVIGHEFDLDVVRAVTGMDDDDALAAVELNVSAGLVVEDPATVGRFRFAHALIREAVYGEISRARRARLHARVGQALLDHRDDDADHVLQLAQHWWLAAPVVGPEQAVPHVIAGAEHCLDTLAHEEAERQLRRSLDLLAAVPPTTGRAASELHVHLRLGTLLVQLHDTASEEAWASFARARELADQLGDSSALLAAYHSLFEVAYARADHRAAGALAERMLGIAADTADPVASTVAHLALGRTLWGQGRLREAREQLEQGLRVAGGAPTAREPLPPVFILQLQLSAVLDPLGELEPAADLVAAAVEGSREQHPFARAAVLTGAALLAALRRDSSAARTWAAEAQDLADRWNFPAPSGYAAVVLGWVEALEGDPGVAIPSLRRELTQIEAGGVQHLLAWGFGLLAEAHLRDQQPTQALRLLDDALSRVARTGERLYESELHRLRALALLSLPEPRAEEARGALHRAVTLAAEQGSVLLQQRAADTCRGAATDRHSGSCDHPDAQS